MLFDYHGLSLAPIAVHSANKSDGLITSEHVSVGINASVSAGSALRAVKRASRKAVQEEGSTWKAMASKGVCPNVGRSKAPWCQMSTSNETFQVEVVFVL